MTSTRLRDINAALVSAYKAVNLGLSTAYEVKDFTPPVGVNYASVYNLYAGNAPATMGDNGDDNYTGIFQVNVFVTENSGTGPILGHADSVLSYFKAGRVFSYNGQEVKVRRSSPSPIRKDEKSASYVISISIYWDSRSPR